MADLIYKSAAIDICEVAREAGDGDLRTVIYRISRLPAVDAVQVVRCGSPCHWLYDEPDDYCCMNHKGLVKITPDSFCSYGERREEND